MTEFKTRRSMKDKVQRLSQATKQQEEANRFMVKKLFELLENDKIDSEFDQGFVRSCVARIYAEKPLSDKQQAYLEKIFHNKY